MSGPPDRAVDGEWASRQKRRVVSAVPAATAMMGR